MKTLTDLNTLLLQRHPEASTITESVIESYVSDKMTNKQIGIIKEFYKGVDIKTLKIRFNMAESKVLNTLYYGVDIIYEKQREEL